MDNNDYNIEYLPSTFEKHAKKAEESFKQNLDKFRDNYPDAPLPDHMVDEFNIAKALSIITQEIVDIKDWIRGHMRNEHPYQ